MKGRVGWGWSSGCHPMAGPWNEVVFKVYSKPWTTFWPPCTARGCLQLGWVNWVGLVVGNSGTDQLILLMCSSLASSKRGKEVEC